MVRIDAGLFFATADALEDRVREVLTTQPGLRAVVVDFGAVTLVDAQGAGILGDVLDLAVDQGVVLRLARVAPGVRATLARDGVLDRLGLDRVHGSVHRAVDAQRRESA